MVRAVRFAPGRPEQLRSVGLDQRLLLHDRRLDAVVAAADAGVPLTALSCRYDGLMAVGTAGELTAGCFPCKVACSSHSMQPSAVSAHILLQLLGPGIIPDLYVGGLRRCQGNLPMHFSGGSILLYDERNLKAPAARLQCAEDAFVLDLHWRPPPQAPSARAASAVAVTNAGAATSGATPADPADHPQQQRQPNAELTSRAAASRQTSPTKSSSSRSRFGDENAQVQPGRGVNNRPGIIAQQARPTVEVRAAAADRPQQAALGSPPRSPRATLRQLLDGGSPVRDPAAAAAITAAAAETQRQVHD